MKAFCLCFVTLLLTGCATHAPRNDSAPRRSSLAATGTIVGATAGAAAGAESKGTKGAAIGAAGGAIVGYAAGRVLDKRSQQAVDEAYEAGRRAAAAEVMARYWEKNAVNAAPREEGDAQPVVEVAYPSGVYQGVRMLPHSKPLFDDGSSEPPRK